MVNLAQAEAVDVVPVSDSHQRHVGWSVVAQFPGDRPFEGRRLCSCDDEEHGDRIIVELAAHIHGLHMEGRNVVAMHDVLKRLRD